MSIEAIFLNTNFPVSALEVRDKCLEIIISINISVDYNLGRQKKSTEEELQKKKKKWKKQKPKLKKKKKKRIVILFCLKIQLYR